MRRKLPILLAIGAGVALLAFSRRASASEPVFISDADGYEAPQSVVPAPRSAPLIDFPALDWPTFEDWGAWPEPPIWGEFPVPGLPSFPSDLPEWDYPVFGGESPMPVQNDPATNLAAFLYAIRWAEGTANADGYRTLFGGSLFDSFADHPRIAQQFTNRAGRTLWTTAAGAYQFMAISPLPSGGTTRVNTWDRMQAKLGLPDFSPESQDAAAIELIREAGALDDVMAGRFAQAVEKVRGIWASLPGAGYDQPERPFTQLASVYEAAGGTMGA